MDVGQALRAAVVRATISVKHTKFVIIIINCSDLFCTQTSLLIDTILVRTTRSQTLAMYLYVHETEAKLKHGSVNFIFFVGAVSEGFRGFNIFVD